MVLFTGSDFLAAAAALRSNMAFFQAGMLGELLPWVAGVSFLVVVGVDLAGSSGCEGGGGAEVVTALVFLCAGEELFVLSDDAVVERVTFGEEVDVFIPRFQAGTCFSASIRVSARFHAFLTADGELNPVP